MKIDFSGWASKNDLKCSDGRIIRRNAFKDDDGRIVPLVWMHHHNDNFNVLGQALLTNKEEGVWADCTFNDTEAGKNARILVEHGDITSLSIAAGQLKQQGPNVMHGVIQEVSLVLAGANPGASIQSVMKHGEESDEEAVIYTGEGLILCHADETEKQKKQPTDDSKEEEKSEAEKIYNSLSEKQKNVVDCLIGMALEEKDFDNKEDDDYKGGDDTMKHNIFDQQNEADNTVLTHADQVDIIKLAKQNNVGSLQTALKIYAEENDLLKHGIEEIESLFPDYKDVRPGAPEFIQRDQGWVGVVMQKTSKSPISRIRTRQADIRGDDLTAYGYDKSKGQKKKDPGNIKLLKRTTDPQTVYRRDSLHRDDIIDITEFDVVNYIYSVMRMNLNEEIAKAILIGDGRDEGSEEKIAQEHIRSIWLDDDLYTIHADVDIDAAKKELQGTNTSINFGENYIYAEAIITAALYSREQYKGSGSLDFFCTPHLLNVMLLARDLNGRRIYDSKSDLAAALNVGNIFTVEQFEGRERTDKDQNKHKLLGLFVNLADYQIGCTRGGEITKFDQFDIDFNQYKYLIETRISGALTRVYSAIALEEPVGE